MADTFVQGVRTCLNTNDADALASYFAPVSEEPLQLSLQQQLRSGAGTSKSYQALAKRAIPDEIFAILVAEYLVFLRNGDCTNDDARQLLAAYKLLETTFLQIRQVLQRSEKAIYIPVVRRLANGLVSLALRADQANEDPENTCCSAAARSLTLALNLAASGDESPKRAAVMFLANAALRVYFQLKNPRMGTTVVKNTGEARNNLGDYPKADQVEFLYYCGRMSLFERSLRKASSQLDMAWRLCPQDDQGNQRHILIYLIAVRLILGILPSQELLQLHDLEGPFWQLSLHLKQGNFKRVRDQLWKWQLWHLQKGTYLLLLEKLEVICWRNLLRKVLLLSENPLAQPGKSPTLKLSIFTAAARYAFADPSLDSSDVECMVISLIDQGYLKAYIWHATGQIVFQKGSPFGFPPVAAVRSPYE